MTAASSKRIGRSVARRATARAPETKVILYTGSRDPALLRQAAEIGVRGFVLKEAPLADLVRAIETVAGGGTYVDVLSGFRSIPNPEQNYMPVDGHPTAAGHAMISGVLAQALTSGAAPALSSVK